MSFIIILEELFEQKSFYLLSHLSILSKLPMIFMGETFNKLSLVPSSGPSCTLIASIFHAFKSSVTVALHTRTSSAFETNYF